MIKHVGYISYDTEDIIGKCPECKGDFIDAPYLAADLDLSESDKLDFEIGFWTIGYCPVCGVIKMVISPSED